MPELLENVADVADVAPKPSCRYFFLTFLLYF